MNKVTYIFGAGASKYALPVVNEIPGRIKRLIETLESEAFHLDDAQPYDSINTTKSKRIIQLEMIESLRWMMNASANHASIDTFAKKLFIKREYDELKRLKIALSVFFIFEQALNKPDFRYDAFFASLIKRLSTFPDHVKILSWNYDYQFELAFSEYTDRDELFSNQRSLQVISKYGDNESDRGFIYKLNGTTGLYAYSGRCQYMYASNLKVPFDRNFVDQVCRNYGAATYMGNIYSSLSFAWESEKSIVPKAIRHVEDTVALVIIGYSFPFFNREIDRQIIGAMTHLKKVYFQAPDAETLSERFEALRDHTEGIELLVKHDVRQFLLPNEL